MCLLIAKGERGTANLRPLFLQDKKEISREHKLVVDSMTFDKAGMYVCKISVPEIEGMNTVESLRVQVQGKDIVSASLDLQNHSWLFLDWSFIFV